MTPWPRCWRRALAIGFGDGSEFRRPLGIAIVGVLS